jgi:hypothetical protein
MYSLSNKVAACHKLKRWPEDSSFTIPSDTLAKHAYKQFAVCLRWDYEVRIFC